MVCLGRGGTCHLLSFLKTVNLNNIGYYHPLCSPHSPVNQNIRYYQILFCIGKEPLTLVHKFSFFRFKLGTKWTHTFYNVWKMSLQGCGNVWCRAKTQTSLGGVPESSLFLSWNREWPLMAGFMKSSFSLVINRFIFTSDKSKPKKKYDKCNHIIFVRSQCPCG